MNEEAILEAVEKATDDVLRWHQEWLDSGFSWHVDATSEWRGEQNVYSSITDWMEGELTGEMFDGTRLLERYVDRFSELTEDTAEEFLRSADYQGDDWIEENWEEYVEFNNAVYGALTEIEVQS